MQATPDRAGAHSKWNLPPGRLLSAPVNRKPSNDYQLKACEVFDFDEALLNACAPWLRADLLTEAELVAEVFAPSGRREDLEGMAAQLSAGQRDAEMDRCHARKLAAALRHLARAA